MDSIIDPGFFARYADTFYVAGCVSVTLLVGVATYGSRNFANSADTVQQETGRFVFQNGVLLPHEVYIYDFSETGEPYILGKKLPGTDYSATEARYAKLTGMESQTVVGESKIAANMKFMGPLLWFLFGVCCALVIRWAWSKLAARLSKRQNNKEEESMAPPADHVEKEYSKLNRVWRSKLISMYREQKIEISMLSRFVVQYRDQCLGLVARIKELVKDIEADADVLAEIAVLVRTQAREIEIIAQTAFDNLKEEHAAELDKQKRKTEDLQEELTTKVGILKDSLAEKDRALNLQASNLEVTTRRAEAAEKAQEDQRGTMEKMKKAKKKFEGKKKAEVEKARTASEEEAKKVKSDFDTTLATKDNAIAEQEAQISTQATEITRLTSEVGQKNIAVEVKEAANIKLVTENETLTGSLNEARAQTKELEGHVERQASNAQANKSKAKDLSDQELRRQIEELETKHADELTAKDSELNAVRVQLDTEEAARLDVQREKTEAESRIDIYVGEIAHVMEQKDALRATLDNLEKVKKDAEEGLSEEAKYSGQEDVNDAPLSTKRGSGGLQYNRNKLRSNKRPDGSIYTSKHPRSTPSRQQGVGEQRSADKEGALDGQQCSETQPENARQEPVVQVPTLVRDLQASNQDGVQSSKSEQVTRVCPYYQQGYCKFGAKCFNSHELPTSSDNSPNPPEESLLPGPTPARVEKSNNQHEFQSSAQEPGTRICSFFRRGKCRFGVNCRDSHVLSVGTENPRTAPGETQSPPQGNQSPLHGSGRGSIGTPSGPRGGRGGASNGFRGWRGRRGRGRA